MIAKNKKNLSQKISRNKTFSKRIQALSNLINNLQKSFKIL